MWTWSKRERCFFAEEVPFSHAPSNNSGQGENFLSSSLSSWGLQLLHFHKMLNFLHVWTGSLSTYGCPATILVLRLDEGVEGLN